MHNRFRWFLMFLMEDGAHRHTSVMPRPLYTKKNFGGNRLIKQAVQLQDNFKVD